MKTFRTPLELRNYASANLQLKLKGTKLTKKLLVKIVKEEKKNHNVRLAIAKLLLLLPHTHSVEQEYLIYNVLALKMSQCTHEDSDLIDYIIINGQRDFLSGTYHEVIYAMCYLLRYIFGFTAEFERKNIIQKYVLLKGRHLSHFFEPPVFTVDNRLRKEVA